MITLALTDLTHVCFFIGAFAFATGMVCGVLWGIALKEKSIGKPSRTADGFLVGPGAVVYGPSPIDGDSRVVAYDWCGPQQVADGDRFLIAVDRCHSTRRRAEAAAELRTRLRLCQAGACGKERAR